MKKSKLVRHPHHEAHNVFITFMIIVVILQSGLIFWLYTNGGKLPWA